MSEAQDRLVEELLAPLMGLRCQSASISTHGALQLGFGPRHSVILGGRHHKSRHEWEVGSCLAIWSYVDNGDVLCSGRSNPREDAVRLLQRVSGIVSVSSTGPVVTLGLGQRRGIVFDGTRIADDEVIYFHGPGTSVFFHSANGWHSA